MNKNTPDDLMNQNNSTSEKLGDLLRRKTNDETDYFKNQQFYYITEIVEEYFSKHTLPFLKNHVAELAENYKENSTLPKYKPIEYHIDMILFHDILNKHLAANNLDCVTILNDFITVYPRFYAGLCNLIENEKLYVLNYYLSSSSASTIFNFSTMILIGLDNKSF